MKKEIIIISSLLIMLILCLSLNYSNRINKLFFSKIINPYNPLLVRIPKTIKVKTDSHDFWKDSRGLFPILAYNTPDKSKDLTASLKIIENGGINILINGNESWMPVPYRVKEAFDKLENSNLRWLAIIENECKNDFIFNNSNDETNAHIKKYLRMFNDKYVYGWYVWDEPGRNRKLCTPFDLFPNDDYADINRMIKQIRSDSTFNKKLDFVNLFPTYWDGTPSLKDYEDYIDAFISSQKFKPRVLCFDSYPFLKTELGGFRRDYYSNLDVLRKKSLQYNIPFWMIVLSSEHLNYKKPTYEEISLQVFSAFAYGAKGIGYYLYSKSLENIGYKSWILEKNVDNDIVADSLHGPLYLPIKKLNEQIQTFGKILVNLNCVEVIHTSNYPNKQKNISGSILKGEKSDLVIRAIININNKASDPKILIGILKDKKSEIKGKYMMIVNKDVTQSVVVNVLLNKTMNIYKINKKNGKKLLIGKSDTLEANIIPGSGVFFYAEQ